MGAEKGIGTRILVIGCPGSGKSVFSARLREKTGLPLYHLDNLFWKRDRTTLSREEFDAELDRLLKQEAWILDGDYYRTLERRVAAADTVIFLDYPEEVCMDGILRRIGKPREDLPWVETEPDPELVEKVRTYRVRNRPGVFRLKDAYPDRNWLVLESREQAEEWLRTGAGRP